MKLSHNDITAFINAIVETPGLIEIRNGRIAWVGKEIVEIAITRDKMGQLWTYTRNPEGENSVILNPFIETIGVENSVRNWFYTYLTSTFGLHLYNCMAFLLQVAANQSDQYPSLIKYNEGLGDVNETLLKELQYLYDSHADGFFSLRYNAKEKCTVPFFGILDPTEEYRKAIPQGKVRKKSWVLLERLLRNIFQQNSEDIVAEYTTCTDSLKCPNFKTYIPSWYRLWRAIEPIIVHSSEDIGVTVNDNLSLIEINLDTLIHSTLWHSGVVQLARSRVRRILLVSPLHRMTMYSHPIARDRFLQAELVL